MSRSQGKVRRSRLSGDVYQKLYEAPDPGPLLNGALVRASARRACNRPPMCPETFQVAAGLAVHQPSCPMTSSPGPARTGAQLVPQCPSAAPPRLPQEAGARCAELEAAAARLAGELADFKAESRQLRNQDLTIRRLEERARALEAELAAKARCPRRPPATPRLP